MSKKLRGDLESRIGIGSTNYLTSSIQRPQILSNVFYTIETKGKMLTREALQGIAIQTTWVSPIDRIT